MARKRLREATRLVPCSLGREDPRRAAEWVEVLPEGEIRLWAAP
jgi:hypothetical protein